MDIKRKFSRPPADQQNGSPGTRIEVRHLFSNTPVRRKFLRTVSTEMGHISEVFTRLALPPKRTRKVTSTACTVSAR
jgi:DNA mismatch repair ATPase MutL